MYLSWKFCIIAQDIITQFDGLETIFTNHPVFNHLTTEKFDISNMKASEDDRIQN